MKKTLLILSVGLSGLICAQNAPIQTSKTTRAKLISPPSNSAGTEKIILPDQFQAMRTKRLEP